MQKFNSNSSNFTFLLVFILTISFESFCQRPREDWVIKMNNEFFGKINLVMENSSELLNKTFYELYFKESQNPIVASLIKDCPKNVIEPTDKSNYEKVLSYNCGSGGISIYLRPQTGKSFLITIDNISVWLYNDEFHQYLQSKYKIRNDGWSEPIPSKGSNIRTVFNVGVKRILSSDVIELQISHIDENGNFIKY